jgi:AraC-like DNA-binding protein
VSVAIAAPRGGLAVWQRRLVAQYVEDHLAEPIPVAALAELARLSRYHFCRSFRRSFGISPHRYHSTRKMERAKMLLADPDTSVTAVALDWDFRKRVRLPPPSGNSLAAHRAIIGARWRRTTNLRYRYR